MQLLTHQSSKGGVSIIPNGKMFYKHTTFLAQKEKTLLQRNLIAEQLAQVNYLMVAVGKTVVIDPTMLIKGNYTKVSPALYLHHISCIF